ncbi:MAG: SH3 domain-containing protein [Thermomicrobiales bacterium]|nr:SH3 domain-containing protein [Thermomicrobiales bacterium]
MARLHRTIAVGAVVALLLSVVLGMPVGAQTSTPTSTHTATPTQTPTSTPTATATPFPCPRDSSGMVGGYADVHRWNSVILQVANETGVPVNVIKAIMWVESGGQLNARSPLTSSGYYFGLMQVGATSSLPAQMKDVMWLCDSAYRQTLAGATEMVNKSVAIGTRQWDLVAGAYFGYGVDVNGTSTSSYMNMFRNHLLALTGTTPGGVDWILPPTPTPGPTNTAIPTGLVVGQQVQVGADRINFRSTPSLSGTVIGILEPGMTATILAGPTQANSYEWYQIRTAANVTGWVAGQFLVASGSPPPPTGTATRTPTRTPVATGGFAQGDTVRVNVARLNMRQSPSLTSNVLTVLDRGNTGAVTGSPVVSGSTIWLPVTISGRGSGWVSAQYVVKTTPAATSTSTRTPTRVASATPSRTATTSASSPFQSGDGVRVAVPLLNLRSTASMSAGVVVVLSGGTTGTVTGTPVSASGYLWIPVTMQGNRSGWVASQYIAKTTSSSATLTPTRTQTAVSGPGQTQSVYQVNVPILNFRASPSTSATVIAKLTRGQQVTYLGQSQIVSGTTWIRIQAGTQTGWVASQYVVRVAPTPTPTASPTRTPTLDPAILAAGESFRVSDGPLNMRTSFGTTATIIRTLPLGTTGSILGGPQTASGYVWYRVSTLFGEGWVVGEYIQRVAVSAASVGEAPGLTASLTPESATATAPADSVESPAATATPEPEPTGETIPETGESPTAEPANTLAPEPTPTATATATETPLPDADGDGVEDELDACPGVADAGIDSDGDGADDACDPTPLGEPTAPPVVEFQVSASASADTSVSAIDPSAVQPGDQTGGLPVGGATGDIAYVTFWVEGVGAAQVSNATLFLPVASGSGTVTVSVMPGQAIDEWSLTYGSAPAGAVAISVWAEGGSEIAIDLTGWITADGAVTIAVSGAVDPAVVLGSKEGGWPARLVLTAAG